MDTLVALFAPLQAAIDRKNSEGGFAANHAWHHHLAVDEVDGLLDVEYRGEYELWFGDDTTVTALADLLRLLASPEVAPKLRSFVYSTAAALAANGTCEYNIDLLVDGGQSFPNLARVSLDQGDGEHGYKILTSPASGDDWNEAGVLARLLALSPRLEDLVTPVPPDDRFFTGGHHPLRALDVDAGYGHGGFIRRLAACDRFPELRWLAFTDFRQHYIEGSAVCKRRALRITYCSSSRRSRPGWNLSASVRRACPPHRLAAC